ncbi:GGDEF domain-containing protein [Massilia sp. CCM 9210]|uniref:GGDEF domain-containing protein n=1 Tax=Massilia scottii TaxID=3057166 RepID=UPI002796C6F2|nr:GGDEF domain-containing protein [Massilia sp. CCM 9210]MDQ1812339.1 GGDEF domain-containing protein [Massilia sp. CCM 9210]
MDRRFGKEWSLPLEDEAIFSEQHQAAVALMLPVLGPCFGLSILLFTVWDYLLDPGRVVSTFLVRLALVGLGAIAYVATALRWTPLQRCGFVYSTHVGAIIIAASMLHNGLLYGLAGVTACLFTVSAIAIRLPTFMAIVAAPSLLFFALSAATLTPFGFINSVILYIFSLLMAATLMLAIRVFRQRAYLSEKALLYSSRHDSMTGACNKAFLTELAEREVALARRHGRPLAVAMLDIDHFKRINDDHGHATGDEVIRQLVAACTGTLRSIDHFGRIGGEEFVAIMPETSRDDALHCAERMRGNIEQLRVSTPQGTLRFTASFGVAMLTEKHPHWSALLNDADAAMYRAKNAGRNRVAAVDANLAPPAATA